MNQENDQNTGKNEQSSGEAASAPSASASEEMMQVRRPRPGSILILAPSGTAMLWVGSEDGLKLELRERSRE